MVKRTISWTETAAKQRREVLKYWTRRNGSSAYAEKLIEIIAIRVKSIQKHPEAYKSTNYPGVRATAIGHFGIYYRLTERQIIIVAFWDNRQDPKKLLEILTVG